MQPPRHSPVRRGFTLIELMVVMAIIALLLSIAAPRYFNHLDRAREAALRETLVVLRDSIDKFHGDTGRYPESLEELVSRRYLARVPVDPVSENRETWILVPPADEPGVWDVHSGAGGEAQPYADW
ncbi:type II secretion system protein G [Rhodoferax lacus]|uniref:Type II secretion system protein G n=1 Tax=Rhodoferax lacus TaxID=2184758 RepID=A0A3E1R9T3_9BURK|nr:prepilin-type N-terminal cleavage/methylation domain-containing protein [Rhodoferax lacus]RFO95782.1 type II secretion system protein G [Rhodoferax lacus]